MPIAIVLSLWHLYTAQMGMFPVLLQRSLHLAFIMVIVFLVYPVGKARHKPWMDAIDIVLILLSLLSFGYVVYYYDDISVRELMASPVSTNQLILGAIAIILILEATRRTIGIPLMIVVMVALTYVYAGQYFPGGFVHKGWSFEKIIAIMYLSMDGIYGVPLGVSATYAFLFILFGAFLHATGVGQFFITLATSVAGRARGGPAKIAVVASALFGTISGATMANVFSTGNFTIPMMKRLGYRPNFAGAVEAVASAGGQIMPPVMGAVAFVMSDVTGIPYLQIVKAAILPALLYFFALMMMIHFEAIKLDLRGLPPEEVPALRNVMRNLYLLGPVILLVVILIAGFSPFRAAFFAIVGCVFVSMFRAETRLNLRGFALTLEKGARDAVMIAAATGCAGIIVGAVAMTGVAVEVTGLILSFGQEFLLIPLMLTMFACIIMGMEMPTVPAYIIVAALAVPTLIKIGVPVMPAHLFALYFAVVAVITPPVCSAAYAAASISGGDMLMTGLTATRLGIVAFVVPYMFVYSPALLMNAPWPRVLLAIVTAMVGVISLAAGLERFFFEAMKKYEVPCFIAGGLLLIFAGWRTDILGFICVTAGYLSQYQRRRKLILPINARAG